jgi:hypothetical protein
MLDTFSRPLLFEHSKVLIQPSAWKVLSANFALTEFSEVRLSGPAKYTPPRLSQRVIRMGSRSVTFQGSAIVPTQSYPSFQEP